MRKLCYIAARIDFHFMYATKSEYIEMSEFETIAKTYFDDLLDYGIGKKNFILMRIVVKYLNEYCGRDYYYMDWDNERIYCTKTPI